MKAKKIPLYGLTFFAVLGASLTLGFLSFGGMFALLPILPLAIAALVLSTAYEGEINLKNIQGALTKLFKRNYLKRHFAKEYLLEHAAHRQHGRRPAFFRDYEKQLKLLHKLQRDCKKDSSLKPHKKQAQKKLNDMEKWFAQQLFAKKQGPNQTAYAKELARWLQANEQASYQSRYKKRAFLFHFVKAFSLVAGVFMTIGTSFMLAESIATIAVLSILFANPILAPFLLVLTSALLISAGVAWALLTYNTITDIINNNVIKNWFKSLENQLVQGHIAGFVLRLFAVAIIIILAITLTLFTAGTWWTIAKTGKPFFSFLSKLLPDFVMTTLNPIITGTATVAFNFNNSYETYQEFDEAMKAGPQEQSPWAKLKDNFEAFKKRENWLQRVNPFRILLVLTISPLLFILFIGHLISISVTADRFPGVSPVFTTFVGFLSEFFEDFHYFIPLGNHQHDNGRHKNTQELLEARHKAANEDDHDNNIPKRLIKAIFSPLYLLAITWDWAASKKNAPHPRRDEPGQLGFIEACQKHKLFIFDYKRLRNAVSKPLTDLPEIEMLSEKYSRAASQPSEAWRVEHALYRIKLHEEKNMSKTLLGREKINDKKSKLNALKDKIQLKPEKMAESIAKTARDPAICAHRFINTKKQTRTQMALIEIQRRVAPPAA